MGSPKPTVFLPIACPVSVNWGTPVPTTIQHLPSRLQGCRATRAPTSQRATAVMEAKMWLFTLDGKNPGVMLLARRSRAAKLAQSLKTGAIAQPAFQLYSRPIMLRHHHRVTAMTGVA